MLAARDLINKSEVMRISNGESISVWDDPWIPSTYGYKICTPVVNGLENVMVSNLVTLDKNAWDVYLLRDVF